MSVDYVRIIFNGGDLGKTHLMLYKQETKSNHPSLPSTKSPSTIQPNSLKGRNYIKDTKRYDKNKYG